MTGGEALILILYEECRDTNYERTSDQTLPKRSPDVLRVECEEVALFPREVPLIPQEVALFPQEVALFPREVAPVWREAAAGR